MQERTCYGKHGLQLLTTDCARQYQTAHEASDGADGVLFNARIPGQEFSEPIDPLFDSASKILLHLTSDARELRSQRGERTAVLGMHGMAGAQVGIDDGMNAASGRHRLHRLGELLNSLAAGSFHRSAEEVLLRCEVAI